MHAVHRRSPFLARKCTTNNNKNVQCSLLGQKSNERRAVLRVRQAAREACRLVPPGISRALRVLGISARALGPKTNPKRSTHPGAAVPARQVHLGRRLRPGPSFGMQSPRPTPNSVPALYQGRPQNFGMTAFEVGPFIWHWEVIDGACNAGELCLAPTSGARSMGMC
jgi:hypothetical protein